MSVNSTNGIRSYGMDAHLISLLLHFGKQVPQQSFILTLEMYTLQKQDKMACSVALFCSVYCSLSSSCVVSHVRKWLAADVER